MYAAKKFVSATVALLMAASLAACQTSEPAASETSSASSEAASSAAEPASSSEESSPASGETYEVGLIQLMDHTSLNQIRDSLMAELDALGYGDRINMDYQNAQGEQTNLNSISQKFAGDQKDLIISIATPAALSAAAAAPDIPQVFSAVTDPVSVKLVENLDAPEGNITGTSDAIPVDQVFTLMQKLTPDVKTVGFVYNLGEPNSVSVIEQAKAYLEANGFSYVEATVTNVGEVQQAAQSLVGKCEAFYTPIDNTVASAMAIYADVARQAGLPIYTGADSMVIDGGFATVGIDYTLLGKQTAAMVVKALEGTPISEIPVETLTNFATVVNTTTAADIGVTIPDDVLSSAIVVE